MNLKQLAFVLASVMLCHAGILDKYCVQMDDEGSYETFLQKLYDRYGNQTIYEPEEAIKNDFTCEYIAPSAEVPTSVHALRPGDIKVIAAMGDSLSAANGAAAWVITGVIDQFRGLAWSIGGEYKGKFNDVTTHFSLPNALKFYNPDIKGFATGKAKYEVCDSAGCANLDHGVPGAKSHKMYDEAVDVVNDLKTHPEYDYSEDWKILTLFIGGNNLCQSCVDPVANSAEQYVADIQKGLDYLHENVPKMLVNVMTVFNIDQVAQLGTNNPICKEAHQCFCPCAVSTDVNKIIELNQLNGKYRDLLKELVASGRYDSREDFTVVIQPFLEDTTAPSKPNGQKDTSYYAPDCFHFSTKGHNYAGEALWNNMFQPTCEKSVDWFLGEKLICPTEAKPYIYTNLNSDPCEK